MDIVVLIVTGVAVLLQVVIDPGNQKGFSFICGARRHTERKGVAWRQAERVARAFNLLLSRAIFLLADL